MRGAHEEHHGFLSLAGLDRFVEIIEGRHWLEVHLEDQHVGAQPFGPGGAGLVHVRDEQAASVFQPHLLGFGFGDFA